MKFLVTNDDGYLAPGLKKVVEYLKTIGEVVIVAPLKEQSAKSHAINIRTTFSVKNVTPLYGCIAYAVDSTPADCVRYAIYHLGLDDVDLVVAGVNNGYNSGDDILYSGTVACATEAALRGLKSVALSIPFSSVELITDEVKRCFDIVFKEKLFDRWCAWNINFPPKFSEYRFVHQGNTYYRTYFLDGEKTRQLGESHFGLEEDENSDVYNLHRGRLTIMPLSMDRTKYNV